MKLPYPTCFLAMIFPAIPAGLAATAFANPPTAPVSALWTEYAKTPDTHPDIPNCSYAGYQYGEKSLPHLDGPVHDVTRYGARGDGVTDDSVAIRSALQSVDPDKGGVVYFPNGNYNVSQALFVHTSRTVLRGESQNGVEIIFTQPLNRAYGTFDLVTNGTAITRWSYEGGLIWFAPKERGTTWRPEGTAPDSPVDRKNYRFHWLATGDIGRVSRPARRGDRTLTLDLAPAGSAAAPRPGDMVLLQLIHPTDHSLARHLAGDGPWAASFPWNGGAGAAWGMAWKKPENLRWPVEVAAWNPATSTVTLRQPLRFDVRSEWQPVLQRMGPLLHESGIENLTLRFNRAYTWDKKMHHSEEGWNGPYFNNAIHCWLRDVTLIDADNGPNLTCAKNITLTRFTLKASRPETLDHHHGTLTRSSSHDNLISDFRIESRPLHGLNIESQSTGNVWMRGIMDHGVFDSHRREPFENLRTDVTLVTNDGSHGGNGGPVMGARFVNWNIRTPADNNYMVGWADLTPHGAIVGLQGSQPTWTRRPGQKSDRVPAGEQSGCRIEGTGEVPDPPNLYEAQLQLRLQTPLPSPTP
ncbi:hypothetical protein OPIT5_18375 [Opitutaceae bacterium TAV5]|nr:hypothetical protein OPIT5_18375 [Opitutaceae bacterium TAV5]